MKNRDLDIAGILAQQLQACRRQGKQVVYMKEATVHLAIIAMSVIAMNLLCSSLAVLIDEHDGRFLHIIAQLENITKLQYFIFYFPVKMGTYLHEAFFCFSRLH